MNEMEEDEYVGVVDNLVGVKGKRVDGENE